MRKENSISKPIKFKIDFLWFHVGKLQSSFINVSSSIHVLRKTVHSIVVLWVCNRVEYERLEYEREREWKYLIFAVEFVKYLSTAMSTGSNTTCDVSQYNLFFANFILLVPLK